MFQVSHLGLDHLELDFVQGDRYRSYHSSARRHSVLQAPFVEDLVFSLVVIFLHLFQIKVTEVMCPHV